VAGIEPAQAPYDREGQHHRQDGAELDGVDPRSGRTREPVTYERPVDPAVPREPRDVEGVDQDLPGQELDEAENRQQRPEDDDPVEEDLQPVPSVMAVVRQGEDPEPAGDRQGAEDRRVELLRADGTHQGGDQGRTVGENEHPGG
jgi:hypothetical protein